MKKKQQLLESMMDAPLMSKHPVLINAVIIIAIALLGILIVYFSLAIFTKHGRQATVPGVENMSYTQAVERLHDAGFRVEIRDSLYRDDVRPGMVIEQYPKSNTIAKPGRKIFLYINAVNPKQVVIDEENRPGMNAMQGVGYRQTLAHLQELGFKNIRVARVLGENKDAVIKVMADGRVIKKMQRVPVNARIVIEVCDGRLALLYDSLYNIELANEPAPQPVPGSGGTGVYNGGSMPVNEPVEEEEELSPTYQYVEPASPEEEGGSE